MDFRVRLIIGWVVGIICGLVLTFFLPAMYYWLVFFIAMTVGIVLYFVILQDGYPWRAVKVIGFLSVIWLVLFEAMSIVTKVLQRRIIDLTAGSDQAVLTMLRFHGYLDVAILAAALVAGPALIAWLFPMKR
mgnify:CR=1 FL=1